PRRVRRGERRRGVQPPPGRRGRRPRARAHPPRPQAHLQPRLLHLGGAAGCGNRRFRPPQGSWLLAGACRRHPGMGSPDRGIQCGGRRRARPLTGMAASKAKTSPKGPATYLELREELARRDRSLRDKVVSLEDATSFVRDGDTVGIGGSTMSRTPMGMIWALIRADRKGLTCARSIVSSAGDLLFASGVCDRIVTSWFSQGILWGVSKVMRHHVETGKARFDEWSHMAMGMRFRAGAMGVPFMPIRSMLGSDVQKQRPEAVEIDCPFTG